MNLRAHPLMSYRGIPQLAADLDLGIWRHEQKTTGEVGVLIQVRESHIAPGNRCFLVMQHDVSVYMEVSSF
jgi:hypothetical protein